MLDRFTDRARAVMQLANQEAYGRRHRQLGVEHLLLALLREGHGLASVALEKSGVELIRLQREIEKISPPGAEVPDSDRLLPSPDMRRVVVNAIEDVRRLKGGFVDTEHLLLGLLRIPESKAAHVLRNLNITLDQVHTELYHLLNREQTPPPMAMQEPIDEDASGDFDMRQTVKHITPPAPKKQVVIKPREPIMRSEMDSDLVVRLGPAPGSPAIPANPAPFAAPAPPVPPAMNGAESPGAPGAKAIGPAAVDQAVRHALQLCWASLPEERKQLGLCGAEFRRLVERALRDFDEDMRAFGQY